MDKMSKEPSLEVILMVVVMVVALLINAWNLAFIKVQTDNFHKVIKYILYPSNFILIFSLLVALGARVEGIPLIVMIYMCAIIGELTRMLIGYGYGFELPQDNRMFVTSAVLSNFGLLFGSIYAVMYLVESIDNKK